MKAGPLNSRITIQHLVAGQEPDGQPVDVWTNLIPDGDGGVWANIRNLRGSEAIRADKDTSTVQTSIRIRRRTDVTAAMRVVFGPTTYEIKAVLPDEVERDKMDLVCEVVQ